MLYGAGLTNTSYVKFTSFTDSYGEECKSHDGNQIINCTLFIIAALYVVFVYVELKLHIYCLITQKCTLSPDHFQ